MPTYQYACTACGHELEAVQSFTDAALTTCPVCQGSLRKVFSAVGVVFKGSGFYKTDSRSTSSGAGEGKPKPDSKADTKTESTSGSTAKGESKTESKPAAAPSSAPAST